MRFFSRPRHFVTRYLRPRRASGTRLILLYHRVACPEHDPFALSVSPSMFQDHLRLLRSRCQMVTLDELLDTRTASRSVLASITFDDGYVDNLTTAAPILQQAGIPATFFICTGSLGDIRGFWWDRVATAIAAADPTMPAFELTEPMSFTGDLSSADARRQTTLTMAGRLRRMPPTQRDRVVEELERVLLATPGSSQEPCPVLDERGVRELGSHACAQLGAHTHGHPQLSVLEREEQLAEINCGADLLQTITGTRPRFLAYPYGGPHDYNGDSHLAAKAAGLDAAFVNHGGPFDPDRHPYQIPRTYMPPLPADDFRCWLEEAIAP